jgi:RNA polymerase sigma-70 factor (ECF subfamily)
MRECELHFLAEKTRGEERKRPSLLRVIVRTNGDIKPRSRLETKSEIALEWRSGYSLGSPSVEHPLGLGSLLSGEVRLKELLRALPSAPPDFHAIYQRWFDEVSRWIRAMGGPEAEREDLAQDVFLVVHRRLPEFDGQNVAGWLYRIARHRVRDFRRLSWVKHMLFGSVPLSDNLAKGGASPAESLETKEKRKTLEGLLDKLNASERAALMLFEIDGYSGEEIAEIQCVPVNTVWARIHKAKKKLKASLAELENRKPNAINAARRSGNML